MNDLHNEDQDRKELGVRGMLFPRDRNGEDELPAGRHPEEMIWGLDLGGQASFNRQMNIQGNKAAVHKSLFRP